MPNGRQKGETHNNNGRHESQAELDDPRGRPEGSRPLRVGKSTSDPEEIAEKQLLIANQDYRSRDNEIGWTNNGSNSRIALSAKKSSFLRPI